MGSLHYIAPEILDGSGHSFQVDLFSLGIFSIWLLYLYFKGVIFYEFICGALPFDENEKDPIKVY
jgi:cGMP-dependent protein kinase